VQTLVQFYFKVFASIFVLLPFTVIKDGYTHHITASVAVTAGLLCPGPVGWDIMQWWPLSVRRLSVCLSVTCLTLSREWKGVAS